MFTLEALIGMLYSLGEAERNPLLYSKVYAHRFPNVRMLT